MSETAYTFVNSMPLEDIEFIIDVFEKECDDYKCDLIDILGEGSFARVYSYKNYAIKYYIDDCNMDGKILEEIGNSQWFPKLYFYNDNFMVVEKIDGINVEDLMYDSNYNYSNYDFEPISDETVDKELYPLLNEKGYIPGVIHSENVMITPEGRLVIVDVGLFKEYHKTISYLNDCESEIGLIKYYIKSLNDRVIKNREKNYAVTKYENEMAYLKIKNYITIP